MNHHCVQFQQQERQAWQFFKNLYHEDVHYDLLAVR